MHQPHVQENVNLAYSKEMVIAMMIITMLLVNLLGEIVVETMSGKISALNANVCNHRTPQFRKRVL